MAFDAGTIESRLTLDRSDFQRELAAARADGDKGVKVPVKVDNAAANKSLNATQARADKLSKSAPSIKVGVTNATANTQIDGTQAKADKLGATRPTIRVGADTSGANAQIAATKKNADGLGTAFSKVPLLVSGITAALPAAISLTGVLAGGAVAVGGAFATAGLATAAFGAVAKPMFAQTETAMKKVTAAQLALTKATTDKQRTAALLAEKQAMLALTPEEAKLAGALNAVKGEWKGLTTSLQPDVWRAIGPYIRTAETSMGLLPAVVRPAAGAIHDVGAEVQALMSSGTTQQFAQFIGGTGSYSLKAGGSLLVATIKTVEELLPQFRPLIDDADKAIIRIGTDMERWAGSSGTSNGIQAFIAWVQANGPVAEAFLKNLGAAIINVGKAAGADGISELKLLSVVLKGLSDIPPGFLTPVITGLTAISLLSKVSAGASLLNWVGKLAVSSTGITAAGTALKGFTAEQTTATAITRAFGASQETAAASTAAFAVSADGTAVALTDMTVAERAAATGMAALDAVSPLGWAVLASAAVAGLAYGLIKLNGTAGDLVATTNDQYKASGLNVAGYQSAADALGRLGTQLSATKVQLVNVHTGMLTTRASVGQLTGETAALTAAQKADLQTASLITGAMGRLGVQYGVSGASALSLAKAAGTSAQAWTGQGLSTAKAASELAKARGQVEQYIITNDRALPKQQEANALIQAMGDKSLTAAQRLDALDTSYDRFVGDLISRQQALASAKTGISNLNQEIDRSGISSHASASAVQSWIGSLPGLASKLGDSGAAMRKFLGYEQDHVTALLKMHGLTATERSDLEGTQKFLDTLAESQKGVTQNERIWAQAAVNNTIPTLQFLGANSKTTHLDMDNLAASILKTGTDSQSSQDARQTLIKELETAGATAKEAHRLVDGFSTAVSQIPHSAHLKILVDGHGDYSVQALAAAGGHGGRTVAGAAAGMLVTGGTPGRDSVLVNAMPDELIVPVPIVQSGAVDHLRGKIPGFAGGGVVGSYSGSVKGEVPWIGREYAATEKAIEQATAAAVLAGIRKARSAATFAGGLGRAGLRQIEDWWIGAGGPGGGTAHVAAAITGPESGFNVKAVQQGQPYATTGWGLWQITPGNSEPQAGVDQQLLTGPTNARAAVAKYRGAGGFSPWTTFEDGAYLQYMAAGGVAAPGWAWVGERGPELVRMNGGETVLPHAQSLMTAVPGLPGYATGTLSPGVSGGGDSGGGGREGRDYEAQLKRKRARLDEMKAKAAAHIKDMLVPVHRDELYLLEHPDATPAKRKALEASIAAREKGIAKYRKDAQAGEATLEKEVRLLRTLVGAQPPGRPGKIPPGIGAGGRKKELEELAKAVTGLSGLKKTAREHLGKLRRPLERDELYLLQHPGLSDPRKLALEDRIRREQRDVSRYRKAAGAKESVYAKEIALLRSLTGEPSAAQYGGAGGGSGSAGAPSALPPPSFVGGAGGAGGFAAASVTPISTGSSGDGSGAGSGGGSGIGTQIGGTITPPGTYGGGPVRAPRDLAAVHARPLTAAMSGPALTDRQVDRIVAAISANAGRTATGVGQAVSGVGRGALHRGYYS